MSFYLSAIILGLGFASLAMGIFISMRIFNIPDITTDGSFTTGGVVTAVLLSNGYSPIAALAVSFLAGTIAGTFTGFIHAKLKVNALLAGILVMTALYSVNLGLMGRSNIPLINAPNIFNSFSLSSNNSIQQISILIFIVSIIFLALLWLLKTDFGLSMRATGNNEKMIRAFGVDTDAMKIFGIALANGLTAISGFLITEIQGFADINMGIGIVIIGLGSVMIGQILFSQKKKDNLALQLIGVIAGSILFRLILAFALSVGVDPIYLKLVVAVFVLIVVSIPNFKRQS